MSEDEGDGNANEHDGEEIIDVDELEEERRNQPSNSSSSIHPPPVKKQRSNRKPLS